MHGGCDAVDALRQDILQLIIPPVVLLLLLWSEPPLRMCLAGHLWLCSLVELHGPRGVHVHAGLVVVVVPVVGARRHPAEPPGHGHAPAPAAQAGLRVLLRAALDGGHGAHGPGLAGVLRLLKALELPEVRGVVVVLLLHLLADGDEVPHALNVVGVRVVDLLVELQRLRVGAHAPVAGGHHQPPLHLVRLDLRGAAEEGDGGLVHLLLHVVDAQPGDDVHVHGPVPPGLEVVVEGLRLVAGLVEEVGQSRKDPGVGGPALGGGHQKGEPLVRLGVVAELLVDVAQLPHHLALALRDGDQLVEGEEGLLVLAYVHVDQAKVVDGIQAICTDADGLEVHLLCTLKLVVHEHAVAFVHQGTGIVSVCLDCNVGVLLRVRMVCLEEVQEREVRRRTGHERRLLALKLLQHRDGLIELLPPQEVRRLRNLQLGSDPGETVVVQRVDDPVIAGNSSLFHGRSDQVGGIDDEPRSLPLAPLDVLSESVVALGQGARRVFGRGGRLPHVELLLVEVLQPDLLDVQQLEEAALHFLLVAQRVVAEHEVKASHKVEVLSSVHQEVLV
mmetsp:Transcript_52646/g.157002  ORF Transcript_52646/g.157002 Transcript_52646/m.157002 type:complete len:558 (+) Transcript_52646:218-1891(+)